MYCRKLAAIALAVVIERVKQLKTEGIDRVIPADQSEQ